MRVKSLLLPLAAGVYAAAFVVAAPAARVAVQDGKTTLDGVYTNTQAARGKDFFSAHCTKCHVFEPVTPKLEGPVLGGEPFLTNWEGKSIFQLATTIRLGMPPDGSVIVDAGQAADGIAFILETNKMPSGETALVIDPSARNIKIARPSNDLRR